MARNCKRCKKLLSEFYIGDTCIKCRQRLKNKIKKDENQKL